MKQMTDQQLARTNNVIGIVGGSMSVALMSIQIFGLVKEIVANRKARKVAETKVDSEE